MFALIVCWILFPALLGLLGWGAGGVVQAIAGRHLAFALRVPVGTALLIGLMDLCTRSETTAPLAVPLTVAVGVAGLIVTPPWPLRRPGGAMWAAVIAYGVYAAPIVLSGTATWAGYIKLDDTATWLTLVDRAVTHGHSVSGLALSTYEATLAFNLLTGYPLGSFLPMAIGGRLLGQDIAWLADPWMAFMAALLAMSLYHICRTVLREAPRWIPVAVASLAAQASLLYGYYLWGGIKELANAFLIAAFATCAPLPFAGAHREGRGVPARVAWSVWVRAAVPGAVVLWALVASLSLGGLVWVGPGALLGLSGVVLVLAVRRPRLRAPSRRVAGAIVPLVAIAAYLAYVALRPKGFLSSLQGSLVGTQELGNLTGPLSLQQLGGIWPNGDFRVTPSALTATHLLIALAIIAAVGGAVIAIRQRSAAFVLYVTSALGGALVIRAIASPWLGGKALAIASPAIPFAALMAAGWVLMQLTPPTEKLGPAETGADVPHPWAPRYGLPLKIGAGLVGAAIAFGILWSTLFAYHDASLGPRELYAELSDIGHSIAGQGPALMTEYSPFGARHFLRDAAPESASELRAHLIPTVSGQGLPKGASADIDQFQLPAVISYTTIVLQRSPVGSRPPSPYRLVRDLRFWRVWQRPLQVHPPVIAHLPLGDVIHPGAVPGCSDVLQMAKASGVVALTAAPVDNPLVTAVSQGDHPARWSTGNSFLTLVGAGSAHIPVTAPNAGRFQLWLGGSMRGPISLSVDGHPAGSASNELQQAGQYVPFGQIFLAAGTHTVTLRYSPGWLPGNGGPPDTVGPLVLSSTAPPAPLITVPASGAQSLCGRTLDWVESLGG